MISLLLAAGLASASPPPPTFDVDATPLVPGTTGTVWADGLPPGATAWLLASPDGIGAGPCPAPLGGACLDLAGAPVLVGRATADAAGTARWRLPVPALPVDAVALQAVVLRPGGAALSAPRLTTTRDLGAPGPFSVRTTSDAVGGSPGIPLAIHLPITSTPGPVVVIHHGFQLSPDLYTSYAAHLASWGYVAIRPQMPGTLFSPRTHAQLASDLARVLDRVEAAGADPAGPYGGLADTTRIALTGHSLGGKVSMLLASQDARADAVFGIDPVDAGPPIGGNPTDYPSVTPDRMGDVLVPIGLVGETENASGGLLGQACAPAAENFAQYFAFAVSPAASVEVIGADHNDFLDDPNCLLCLACTPGSAPEARTRAITRRVLTGFLERTLRGDEAARTAVVGASRAEEELGGTRVDTANGF